MTSDPRAFLDVTRQNAPKRDPEARVQDWQEVEGQLSRESLAAQGSRCMTCGVPFCHTGCSLGNHIPDWNQLVAEGRWKEAWDRLDETNPFPEITGRVCPAPCEDACVLNMHEAPVTIRQIEKQLADAAFARGWVVPRRPLTRSGKRVAVIGSGPAGLAAAQRLVRVGHAVTVFERHDKAGGLLRYGIPDFKLDRRVLELRLSQLRQEGVTFRCGVEVGVDLPLEKLRAFDAVLLAIGAWQPRDMDLPGRQLPGVHPALDYLVGANRAVSGGGTPINARGERVIVLGGGDTGADCVGTALRQRARSVQHFHYKPAPPDTRDPSSPWPFTPLLLRPSSSHEEGGERGWSVLAQAFVGDTKLRALRCVDVTWEDGMTVVPGSERDLPADRVFLAVGYTGVDAGWLEPLGVTASRGPIDVDEDGLAADGIYACGDATRGASLVVTAIQEGLRVASSIDRDLRGRTRLKVLDEGAPLTLPRHRR